MTGAGRRLEELAAAREFHHLMPHQLGALSLLGHERVPSIFRAAVLLQSDSPDMVSYSDEELRVAVDETHRLGRKIAVHAMGTESIKAALRAGVDEIEHGF